MPYKNEISEPVKLVIGLESLVHDGTVLGLKKGLYGLFLNIVIYFQSKLWFRNQTKN